MKEKLLRRNFNETVRFIKYSKCFCFVILWICFKANNENKWKLISVMVIIISSNLLSLNLSLKRNDNNFILTKKSPNYFIQSVVFNSCRKSFYRRRRKNVKKVDCGHTIKYETNRLLAKICLSVNLNIILILN